VREVCGASIMMMAMMPIARQVQMCIGTGTCSCVHCSIGNSPSRSTSVARPSCASSVPSAASTRSGCCGSLVLVSAPDGVRRQLVRGNSGLLQLRSSAWRGFGALVLLQHLEHCIRGLHDHKTIGCEAVATLAIVIPMGAACRGACIRDSCCSGKGHAVM
jgi:hypothetical protein